MTDISAIGPKVSVMLRVAGNAGLGLCPYKSSPCTVRLGEPLSGSLTNRMSTYSNSGSTCLQTGWPVHKQVCKLAMQVGNWFIAYLLTPAQRKGCRPMKHASTADADNLHVGSRITTSLRNNLHAGSRITMSLKNDF